ncbi:MAG: cyclic nucleotide-binding domain-containing protein [Chloroflexota bacterium]
MSDSRILEMVDIFSDLTPDQLKLIYSVCKEKVYNKGDLIIQEHTPNTDFYVLLDGEVEVIVQVAENNPPRRIASMDRGHSFGEVALVDQGLRTASIRCISKTCRVFEINREDLMRILRENLEMGFAVMYNLAVDMCWKIRQAQYMAQDGVLYAPRQG